MSVCQCRSAVVCVSVLVGCCVSVVGVSVCQCWSAVVCVCVLRLVDCSQCVCESVLVVVVSVAVCRGWLAVVGVSMRFIDICYKFMCFVDRFILTFMSIKQAVVASGNDLPHCCWSEQHTVTVQNLPA